MIAEAIQSDSRDVGEVGRPALEPQVRQKPPRNLLLLYTQQEAVQRGQAPLDRVQQFVYDAIQKRSTPGNIGRNELYNPERFQLQSALIQDNTLPEILHELHQRRMIMTLPCFEYRPENGWLDVRGYIVARQDDVDVIGQIYEELCVISHKNIAEWLGSLTEIAETLRQDLEKNLRPNLLPPLEHEGAESPSGISPHDLAHWADSEFAVLFDPLRALQNGQFVVPPVEAILKYFAEDQRRELIETKSAISINGLGFLPYHEAEILPCFEIARDFLESNVIPEYLTESNIRREMERIALEEALYEIEVARATTGRFSAARAAILRRLAFSDGAAGAQTVGPGQLACEIVLKLANHAEQRYINEWKESAQLFVENFIDKLKAHENDWRRMVRYVTNKQLANFHPDVWNILRNHPALFYQSYELPDGTMHMFVARDFAAFRILLKGMLELPPAERWRTAALRAMIENYEHRFKMLFADPQFVRDYGRLMRKAYIDYMPVWDRIFLFSGIASLRDYFFRRAKDRIKHEQAFLARRNARLFEEFVKTEKSKRRRMVYGMRDTACASDLIAILERCYFELGLIPDVSEVARMVNGYDRAELVRVLKAANFKVLRVNEGDLLETGILLFPRNGDYPDRMKRLAIMADGLVLRLSEKSAAGLLDDRGRAQLDRARKLQLYLRREKNFVVR